MDSTDSLQAFVLNDDDSEAQFEMSAFANDGQWSRTIDDSSLAKPNGKDIAVLAVEDDPLSPYSQDTTEFTWGLGESPKRSIQSVPWCIRRRSTLPKRSPGPKFLR